MKINNNKKLIEMSLPFIRIIDLRAEGEGAIREAWLPPPHTHSGSVHAPHGPQVVPTTVIRTDRWEGG